jgi:Phage protein D
MITQVRAARPSITLDGTDYYQSLAPYFISLTYTDNCDGKKADDLSIELADRDSKFISTWMPQKGAYLDAGIIAERWFMPYAGSIELDCGRFWIDTVDYQLPDQKMTIKASSIPTDVRIKASKETRGWEDVNLQDLAQQIAGENKMEIDWQAESNPRYSRVEQHEESALGFLQKRCNNAKLAIKVHRNKIVVFDEQKLEEAAPKFSLLYGNVPPQMGLACYRMSGGSFVTKIMDTTKKCKVAHTDPKTGEVMQGEWEAGDQELEDNTDDRINEDTDSDDSGGEGGAEGREDSGLSGQWNASEASTLKAKSHCRDKNKKKDQSHVELSLGNPLIAAGQTFNLVGVGQFDGKWFIESAHHSLGPEYKTELTIRRCLEGY